MFKYKILISIILLLLSTQSYAYNWDKCKRDVYPKYDFWGLGNGIAFFTSSSQWSSSTGACSMLGQIEDQKKYFIAQNLDNLIIDSARGNGEYVYAYAELAGCSRNARQKYSGFLQKYFTIIYGETLDNSAEQVYEKLETLGLGVCGEKI